MIKIDYEKTRSAAKKLSEAAADQRRIASSAQRISSSLSSCWQGDAADAFGGQLDAWVRENQSIQREMESLAADILRITDSFEEAEKKLRAQTSYFRFL